MNKLDLDYKYSPWVILMITNKCNLKCKNCNIWKEKKKVTLNIPVIWKVISKILDRQGCISCVGITGGEPFIEKDKIFKFFSVVSSTILKGRIKHFNITTNGTYPSSIYEFIRIIPNVLLDRISFNISLDGLKKTHNYLRGENIFLKVIKSISFLKQRKIEVTINFVINPFNVQEIYSVYSLSKRLGCNIEYEIFSPRVPSYYHYTKGINFKEQESGWERIALEQIDKIISAEPNNCNIVQLKTLCDYLKSGKIDEKITNRCLTPLRLIFIRATGEIYICPYEKPISYINDFDWDAFCRRREEIISKMKKKGCKKCLSTMGSLNYVSE